MAKLQNVVGLRSILWQPAQRRWVLDHAGTLWMHTSVFIIGRNLLVWVSIKYGAIFVKIFIFQLIGLTLLPKMKAAIDDMHDHVIAHEEFNQSFLHSAVTKWTSEVEAWEKDSSQPNPYVLTVEGMYAPNA